VLTTLYIDALSIVETAVTSWR